MFLGLQNYLILIFVHACKQLQLTMNERTNDDSVGARE